MIPEILKLKIKPGNPALSSDDISILEASLGLPLLPNTDKKEQLANLSIFL
jgi:hypothetical protein